MLDIKSVSRIIELIRDEENRKYFFSKVDSPEWLEPLDKEGWFSSPPNAVRNQERGTIRFPRWPESEYLARVASVAPELVARIMMKVPVTDNVRVHYDLVRAATNLPAGLAATWSKQEINWIREQQYLYLLLPEALGSLIEYLATAGEQETSLEMGRAFMTVNFIREPIKEFVPLFPEWNYKKLLEDHMPQILRSIKIDGLKLLCELLEDALNKGCDEIDDDYSDGWRPAIETHEQNIGRVDARVALVEAIRDGALQLLRESEEHLKEIINELYGRNWPVFKRIAIYILSKYYETELAIEYVVNQDFLYDQKYFHEYVTLLRKVFPVLDDKNKQEILKLIESGPSQVKNLRSWQIKRLNGLQGYLPPEWEEYCSQLVTELGEPKHQDFLVHRTISTGLRSPKTLDEIMKMQVSEVSEYLKTWIPSSDWNSLETAEGLGLELQSVVKKRTDDYINALDLFHGVNSTYARSIIRGITDAINTVEFNLNKWSKILGFLIWVALQSDTEEEYSWSSAKTEIARLFEKTFEKNLLDLSLRNLVWGILDIIADDPDPGSEYLKSNMDPITLSINTTRGCALHTIVKYAVWVRDNIDKSQLDQFNMEMIPEVKKRLEWHLDPSHELAPAVRAIYGWYFLLFFELDPVWTKDNLDKIFSSNNDDIRDVAWHAYLICNPADSRLFQDLKKMYQYSVDQLSREEARSESMFHHRWEKSLGEHLVTMIARGVLSWSDEDLLMKNYVVNATNEDASHAIAFIGKALPQNASQDITERLQIFWDTLVDYISKNLDERIQILSSFENWFIAGCFEDKWAFDQLKYVIKITQNIRSQYLVMERMVVLVNEYPQECLEILEALALLDDEGDHVLEWEDSARKILRTALDSPIKGATSNAVFLISKLGKLGHNQFQDLRAENKSIE